MHATITPGAPVSGTLTVPPDKSICHRAVLLSAIANGRTVIQPWPASDDCRRTLELIERLGVRVVRSGERVEIEGCHSHGLTAPSGDLDCGESGTTFRLAAGLLAGQPLTARLSAAPSLCRRPMRRIVEPLRLMGARVEGAVSDAGEVYPPLTIHGKRPLAAIRYEPPVASAQLKSAILLAGLAAEGRTTVVEAQPTRDHTERMLRRFGVRVDQHGRDVSLEPSAVVSPGELTLPGDFSSAAFFLVAACCVPGSRMTLSGVNLNPTRTALLDVLRQMGARASATITDDGFEPVGMITVEAGPLHGITLEAHQAASLIDELPILMVAAACATGTTRLLGLGELRVKETDRIQSMMNGLQRLGVRCRLLASDAMEIEGGPLSGGEVDSAQDHRTAMSLAIAALTAQRATTIHGADCVSKSFPEFFDRLRAVTHSSTVKTIDKTSTNPHNW